MQRKFSIGFSEFDTSKVTNMNSMFQNTSMKFFNLPNFYTSNAIDMSFMFSRCSSLTSLNLSNFNVLNGKNTRDMFEGCSSLEILDLSNFYT